MKRLVVKYRDNTGDGYVNILCDRIERENEVVYAYLGNALVGVFDLGAVNIIYFVGGEKGARA